MVTRAWQDCPTVSQSPDRMHYLKSWIFLSIGAPSISRVYTTIQHKDIKGKTMNDGLKLHFWIHYVYDKQQERWNRKIEKYSSFSRDPK